MSTRAMRRALVVFVITIVGLLVALYSLYQHYRTYPDRPIESPGQKVTVTIPKGVNFPRIVELLEKAGAVKNGIAFRIFANYKGIASRVRHGTYRINTSVTPRKLLAILVKGVAAPQIEVLIPEGKNMLEVAQILADSKVADRARLVTLMRDPRFLRRLGVPARTMEGFLFPDKYKFRTDSRAEGILAVLFKKHKRVYDGVWKKYPRALKKLRTRLGWGHKEIVTMASIVEKETGKKHERPLVASVFLNRLRFASFQPKRLATDPTIVYGCTVLVTKSAACKRFKKRIRTIHLRDADNPYNTYIHRGLPPGPIANPGEAAIEAVFKPAKSRYLFFVSKNDGTHYFSRTRAQHERAVDHYQRGRGSAPAPIPR